MEVLWRGSIQVDETGGEEVDQNLPANVYDPLLSPPKKQPATGGGAGGSEEGGGGGGEEADTSPGWRAREDARKAKAMRGDAPTGSDAAKAETDFENARRARLAEAQEKDTYRPVGSKDEVPLIPEEPQIPQCANCGGNEVSQEGEWCDDCIAGSDPSF